MEKGIIDISQLTTPPEKHELNTAKFFSEMGKNIVFIRPSNIPSVYRPDILMDGIEWEIKSPQGKGARTIEKIYKKASEQSANIIFDLRRCGLSDAVAIRQLEREFNDKHSKRLLIITKTNELIKFSKTS